MIEDVAVGLPGARMPSRSFLTSTRSGRADPRQTCTSRPRRRGRRARAAGRRTHVGAAQRLEIGQHGRRAWAARPGMRQQRDAVRTRRALDAGDCAARMPSPRRADRAWPPRTSWAVRRWQSGTPRSRGGRCARRRRAPSPSRRSPSPRRRAPAMAGVPRSFAPPRGRGARRRRFPWQARGSAWASSRGQPGRRLRGSEAPRGGGQGGAGQAGQGQGTNESSTAGQRHHQHLERDIACGMVRAAPATGQVRNAAGRHEALTRSRATTCARLSGA